jgi:hypothetical protein
MLKNPLTRLAALRYVFRRAQIDEETKQELDSHVERLADRYRALGMPADEARRAARVRVGNTLRVREDIYNLNTFAWLDWTGAQIRHATRMFTRQPLYTAAIVLTVAIGIASSTMVFSIVDAVLLKPLPFPHAAELVALGKGAPMAETPRAGCHQPMPVIGNATLDRFRTSASGLPRCSSQGVLTRASEWLAAWSQAISSQPWVYGPRWDVRSPPPMRRRPIRSFCHTACGSASLALMHSWSVGMLCSTGSHSGSPAFCRRTSYSRQSR